MIIDIHTHTIYSSFDCFVQPAELIQRAKELGLDGICLTDHNWFWDEAAAAELGRKHDFLVLPGVEVDTDEAHFVVFGLERYIFGMHRNQFLRQAVDEAGGVMILAHPHKRYLTSSSNPSAALERACQDPIFGLVDAIEVFNGRVAERENGFSLEIAERLNLKTTGGSDAHSLSDVGSCATEFERRIGSVKELITELKEGRFRGVSLRQGY